MIKIFFHVAAINDFGKVKSEILDVMKYSGLLDMADAVYINYAHDVKCRLILPDNPKIKIEHESKLNEYEFPTLQMLWDNTEPGDKVLYLHTKGVSNPSQGSAAWRNYMLWGCVERWTEHMEALASGYDTSGVLLVNEKSTWTQRANADKFYAGNFWWANGDYIKKLPRPETHKDNRWLAEGWVTRGNGKYNCLHNISGGKLVTSLPSDKTFSFHKIQRHDYDEKYPIRPRVKSRIEIINRLIAKRNYKSYCEIGVWHHACFNNIKCDRKISVDPAATPKAMYPMTSDKFFETTTEKFDIFFIDGLHTEKQVYTDIQNALERLNQGGIIVCHDCNPETEWEQRDIPDYDGHGIWVGTVWRAFARLRMERPDLRMGVVDTDFGCGLIEPGNQECYPECKIDYTLYARNRKKLMNVINPEDFEKWIS